MPRGEHLRVVEDDEILSQIKEREPITSNGVIRRCYTYGEIADGIDSVGKEAIRKRLVRMDGNGVESVQVGRETLYYVPQPGVELFEGLHQRLDLVAALVAIIGSAVLGFMFVAFLPPVAFGVFVAILTIRFAYPWVVKARQTYAPGFGLTPDELQAALVGADR